ncbi:MAG: 3-oxoacyl-ACP reductase FabG [Bacteroidetes bacterium]|uniref:3-oxoacyl-[acyl-carrier-protein] reductase FabG n=1 Tax=Phaeocystidibacter marisrubri TaxID=1577780 RepID=A0A6L3ZI51_9FLAO|nr:3-oxoacyl-ACP reductase FabG [Phaeocystidibacter marisrubri]KAB2817289.1 3-oxoacyl-ACP reductase FabG [Phaeocystidibacter marisrubri]TNE30358.1 MAG: 3-oxoacyl-ACP reductase FabG [Bacteroidota bacterium]GGH76081.1 beta-ketoacyl-ACP reductase [Phaeocystidibacter marisrubri]
MKRLDNRVAIITGGASGIGKAAVEKFVAEGARVAIWDMNEEHGNALVAAMDGKASFYKVNTANSDEVNAAAEKVIADFGKVDILVNNAGITRDATLLKMTDEQWDAVINVNLKGVFNCTRALAGHFKDNGYGRIVNTSSVVGLYGNFGQSNYVATKAGVIGMTKTWAKEFGKYGITSNAVAPGFIATDMVKSMPEKVLDMMKDKAPLKRLGQPEDIANAYAFLASDEASFISGTVLSVDGAVTI